MAAAKCGRKRFKTIRSLLAVACAAVISASVTLSSTAVAEPIEDVRNDPIILAQNGPFRGFNPFAPLKRLFRGDRERKRQKPVEKRPAATRPAGTAPRFEVVEKDPDAGLILVVGDRMARGVADGLRFTLADKPQIRIERITDDKSGFTGEPAPDWSTQVLSKIRGADVKAVVVMIGREDIGEAFPGEPPVEFMTSEWLEAYMDEIDELVNTVRREKKPVVWAGLPPTNNEILNGDFTQLNSLFQGASEDRRVRYVDIWDIFLAEDGTYSSFGPDVEGKNARLRTNDRIGFTWAGYRKVAFFVERELSRLLGGYGGLAFEGVEDDPNFIVLTGRTTSPESLLLGGEETREIDKNSPAYRYFVKGEPPSRIRGRVDDPRHPIEETSALGLSDQSGS